MLNGSRRARAPVAAGVLMSIFFVAPASSQAPAPAPAAPSAERPTYAVGQRWSLDDGVYELSRADDTVYVFAGKSREIHLTKDLAIARVMRNGRLEFELDPAPPLKWPLSVGEWGTVESTLRSQRIPGTGGKPGTINVKVVWQVRAYESVITPAGAFQGFRIDYSWSPTSEGGSSAKDLARGIFSTWYAPEVGLLVKAQAVSAPVTFQLAPPVVPRKLGQESSFNVQILDPSDGAVVAAPRVPLAAHVSADRGLANVAVRVNGGEVFRHQVRDAVAGMGLNLILDLQQGKNAVEVEIVDSRGASRTITRSVEVTSPSKETR